MRRQIVNVDQPRTGEELIYTVIDREITAGLGANSSVIEVTGTVSSKRTHVVKSPKDLMNQIEGAIATGLRAEVGGILGRAIKAFVPLNTNVGVARATGRKGADRQKLAAIAAAFIIDRFRPLTGGKIIDAIVPTLGAVVDVGVTHNVDTDNPPWAEVRLEIFGLNPFGDLFDTGKIFNFSQDVLDGNGAIIASPTRTGTELPAGDNSRGTWIQEMASQVLLAPADQDGVPPAHPDSVVTQSEPRLT